MKFSINSIESNPSLLRISVGVLAFPSFLSFLLLQKNDIPACHQIFFDLPSGKSETTLISKRIGTGCHAVKQGEEEEEEEKEKEKEVAEIIEKSSSGALAGLITTLLQ